MEGAYLGFGFRISHAQLAQHKERALANETLVVKCRVTALASSLLSLDGPPVEPGALASTPAPRPLVAVPLPCLAAAWGALLATGDAADVALTAGGEAFPAHRAVLAAHSPVLRARLLGALGGPPVPWPSTDDHASLPTLALDDVAPPVAAAFLRYLYTEAFDADAAPVEAAQHLMVCADAHGVERLRLLCERRLALGLDVPSAAYTLVLAEQHNARELKAAALAYVARHAVAVMETQGWEHLCQARPELQREVIRALAMGLPPAPQGGAGGASGGDGGARSADGADGAGRRLRPRHQ
jgi:speckle-type POZ protein